MIATHSIKYNGVWYKAGDEIKETAEVDNTSSAFSKSYTKTEINRMSTADLQKLANEQGFDKAEEISGADLKKMLIEKFGLQEFELWMKQWKQDCKKKLLQI